MEGLPEGLAFDEAAGRIEGMPVVLGYFPVHVALTSPLGNATTMPHLTVVEQMDAAPVIGIAGCRCGGILSLHLCARIASDHGTPGGFRASIRLGHG